MLVQRARLNGFCTGIPGEGKGTRSLDENAVSTVRNGYRNEVLQYDGYRGIRLNPVLITYGRRFPIKLAGYRKHDGYVSD